MEYNIIREHVTAKDYAELEKMSNEHNIICVCYSSAHAFKSRRKALEFWKECMECSEGAEAERYVKLFFAVSSGATFAIDN